MHDGGYYICVFFYESAFNVLYSTVQYSTRGKDADISGFGLLYCKDIMGGNWLAVTSTCTLKVIRGRSKQREAG
jgi:hypothetical protein